MTGGHEVAGSIPVSPIMQVSEYTTLTETDKPDTKPENQNLVSGLFSALENDQDLKLVVENWLELPEHIKAAIKALVQTHSKGTR